MLEKKIAEELAGINPSVESTVIQLVTTREVNKRAEAIVACLDKVSRLKKDLGKIKPDLVAYDSEGKLVSESYSKGQLEARDKLVSQINKINKAVSAALEGNIGDVYNLSQTEKSSG